MVNVIPVDAKKKLCKNPVWTVVHYLYDVLLFQYAVAQTGEKMVSEDMEVESQEQAEVIERSIVNSI